MKVLLSARACDPYQGSEPYFGWSALQCLAQDHELWVLTGRRSQFALERARSEGLIRDNVRVIGIGELKPWHPNRMVARLQDWMEYARFSKAVLPVARGLHQQVRFDLAHHVTIATWRVASPLWKLGIPFVFGPIGGYEQFPPKFFSSLQPSSIAFEALRMCSNVAAQVSPGVRRCLQGAAHVFVANEETDQLVKKIRHTDKGISHLSSAFYSQNKAAFFSRFAADKATDAPLRLFAAGNMEGRKGAALALAALARAKTQGVKFTYRVAAGGPEIERLKRLSVRMGLREEVRFTAGLGGEDYPRELGATHVFLLPSFRESAGLTMMEAMLAGCVPVVADCGGPGLIVTDDCGYKIPVTTRSQMIADLAECIIAIDRNRQIIRDKGRAAARRIAVHFSEDNYRKIVNAVYESVTRRPDTH